MSVKRVGRADGQVDHAVGEGVFVFGLSIVEDATGIGQRDILAQHLVQVVIGIVQEA